MTTDQTIQSAAETMRPLVYILEPNPFMAEMERAVLKSFEVRAILPGKLVGVTLNSPPSLVITEVLLSGIDGLQLCRELKARPETSAVPVLVFSALDASEEAADAGADSFLLKPAPRHALLSEARRLVGRLSKGNRPTTPTRRVVP